MAKKVFISYAWEGETFSQAILEFSNKLRANGIDANIDQYEENPDMGWPIWMEQQIETADYVLVVATKTYLDKFLQLQQGKGVSWEISSIYQSLYNLQGHNNKFIPIVFNEEDKKYIVKALQPYTNYNITTQFDKLANRIKGIKNIEKPPVTEALPPKIRRHMFVSTPIDLELWDKAKWCGVTFFTVPEKGNFLGFLYKGEKDAAKKIFSQWQKTKNLDDYVTISFIEGNIEGLPPNGYTCLVAPNLEAMVNRTDSDDEELVLTISRSQRMYPTDNFMMFNKFKTIALNNPNTPVPIVPVTLIDVKKGFADNNLEPQIDNMVFIKNVHFVDAKNIKHNDLESCVIPKFNSNFPKQ